MDVFHYNHKGTRQLQAMQEFDQEQLENQIAETQDPDLLKELMGYAIQLERDDLVEAILDKSIRLNRLVEKLQDYELQPVNITFLSDEGEDLFAVEPEAETPE